MGIRAHRAACPARGLCLSGVLRAAAGRDGALGGGVALSGISGPPRKAVAVAILCLFAAIGCVHLPRQRYASIRLREYFADHGEVPSSIAAAMDRGHVLLGMDEGQVWAVLGEPVRRATFGASSSVRVWLYPAHRLHQDQVHSHGAQLFRLLFIEGRLALIEPI